MARSSLPAQRASGRAVRTARAWRSARSRATPPRRSRRSRSPCRASAVAETSWFVAERVPDAAHRLQDPRLAALLELPPQVADVHPERIRRRAEVVTPHALVDLRPRQHLPRVAHEQFEQVELRTRELHAPVTARCLARCRI